MLDETRELPGHSFKFWERFKTEKKEATPLTPEEVVAQVNALEDEVGALSKEALAQKTPALRRALAAAILNSPEEDRARVEQEVLEQILPEAFAIVREVSWRTLGLRHYDVQLMGGLALHRGQVAEMKTGEGKTLMSTLAVYLNALRLNPEWVEKARETWGNDPQQWRFAAIDGVPVGVGAHVMTVNDYLARRDARWMNPIYEELGLSVGVLQNRSSELVKNYGFSKGAWLVDSVRINKNEEVDQLKPAYRHVAYEADITYGTHSEFGFDYLRDHLGAGGTGQVQRHQKFTHQFAVIDEVDNVLLDEARTSLVISGKENKFAKDMVEQLAAAVKQLQPGDYELDKPPGIIQLTPQGERRIENILGRPLLIASDPEHVTPDQAIFLSLLEQALRAEFLFEKDKDYLLEGDPPQVNIISYWTGRVQPSRTWSDGLHTAIQAKEGLEPKGETDTNAEISIQNYVLKYQKIAGMTGAGASAAAEFASVYDMETTVIPTHLEYQARQANAEIIPNHRTNYPDLFYSTREAKLKAIVDEIMLYHQLGRPILVGTDSVAMSEELSQLLREEYIPHQVLNARHHATESQIIARAGAEGAVTISTNMAGRGIDIKLGGELPEEIITTVNQVLVTHYQRADAEKLSARGKLNMLSTLNIDALPPKQFEAVEQFLDHAKAEAKVKELGGLYVIGCQRYESRRIDDQLSGRAARQGDPGSSRFFLSLEDELLQSFVERKLVKLNQLLAKLGHDENSPLTGKLATRAVSLMDQAQDRAERNSFEARRQLLAYDQVLSYRREMIYAEYQQILEADNLSPDVMAIIERAITTEIIENKTNLNTLLSWLESIQPTTRLKGLEEDGRSVEIIPSFALSLLLEELKKQHITPENAVEVLGQVLAPSFTTEATDVSTGVEKVLAGVLGDQDKIAKKLNLIESTLEIDLAWEELGRNETLATLAEIADAAELHRQVMVLVETTSPAAQIKKAVADLREETGFDTQSFSDQELLILLTSILHPEPYADIMSMYGPEEGRNILQLKANYLQPLTEKIKQLPAQELATVVATHFKSALSHLERYWMQKVTQMELDAVDLEQIFNHDYRHLLLDLIEVSWAHYLTILEASRTTVGLEAYARRDPLTVYKNITVERFEDIIQQIRSQLLEQVFKLIRDQGAVYLGFSMI